MGFDPIKHHRRSTRLKGFDYSSPGAYAIVICTKKRIRYFADPLYYQMVEKAWKQIPKHFPTVIADTIGIVPDHIHMILCLEPTEKVKPMLGDVVGRFKSDVSRAISLYGLLREEAVVGPIWLRLFYDHIIRDAYELEVERRYALENPDKHRLRDEGCE